MMTNSESQKSPLNTRLTGCTSFSCKICRYATPRIPKFDPAPFFGPPITTLYFSINCIILSKFITDILLIQLQAASITTNIIYDFPRLRTMPIELSLYDHDIFVCFYTLFPFSISKVSVSILFIYYTLNLSNMPEKCRCYATIMYNRVRLLFPA